MEGFIVAVLGEDEKKTCFYCKGDVTTTHNGNMECGMCRAKMKTSICNKNRSVKFVVVEEDCDYRWKLVAHDEEVSQIVGNERGSLADKLLAAPKMKFNIDKNSVVTSCKKLH